MLVQESGGILEAVIALEHGVGSWIGGEGEGSPRTVDGVKGSITLRLAVDDKPHSAMRANVERIRQWGDAHALVRIVSAPGGVATMYGPDGEPALLPFWKRAVRREGWFTAAKTNGCGYFASTRQGGVR